MDHAVLQAVAKELAGHLMNLSLGEVVQLDGHRFLLRFDTPPYPRVQIVIHPRLTTIHLAHRIKAPSSNTELAAVLTRELAGRRVTLVEKAPSDRLLRIGFEAGRTLVVELLGKASNLLLLDGDSRIIRYAQSHQSDFRRPVEGAIYAPPPPPPERMVDGPSLLGELQLRALVEAARQPSRITHDLVHAVPGLSIHIAREVAHRVSLGDDAWEAFQSLLQVRHQEPVLYAPVDPREIEEAETLTSTNLFAFLFPLSHVAGLVPTRFDTVNEAVETASRHLLAHFAYRSIRDSLSRLLNKERRKVVSLLEKLETQLAEAEVAGDRDRRRAELILAGMHDATKSGSVVRVKDHYDPAAPMLEIPIDARFDLRANAQRYFKSARRSQRTRSMIPSRLTSLRARLDALEAAGGRVQATRSLVAAETAERDLQQEGLVHAYRKPQRSDVGRKAEYIPVREYLTRDGFTILVGRSSKDNDRLTFKIAATHDLWLHAAGYPGAHVIVRNPGRLRSIPEGTIEAAAAIAAHFSRGRDEKRIDVHVAWRRHVRKGKGMSPGMVMLKRQRSVRVAPGLPVGKDRFR